MDKVLKEMKSVMLFDPSHTAAETNVNLNVWWKHNKMSAVADKNVPNAEETRKLLHAK